MERMVSRKWVCMGYIGYNETMEYSSAGLPEVGRMRMEHFHITRLPPYKYLSLPN